MKKSITILILLLASSILTQDHIDNPSKKYITSGIKRCFKKISRSMTNKKTNTNHLTLIDKYGSIYLGVEKHHENSFSWYRPYMWKPNSFHVSTLKIEQGGVVTVTTYEGFRVSLGDRYMIFPYRDSGRSIKKLTTTQDLIFWENLTYSFINTIE